MPRAKKAAAKRADVVTIPAVAYHALLEVNSEATRLQERNAQLIEQIQNVSKGSENLIAKYTDADRKSVRYAELYLTTQSNNTRLREANTFASKRLAQYEAQFGFLPDTFEHVEPPVCLGVLDSLEWQRIAVSR